MNFKEKTREHVNNELIFSRLERYVDYIEEKNKVMNLTGFTGDRLWKEGIYESIVSLETSIHDFNISLLDIGAGAGFPSVPFAIAHPEVELTVMEPLIKRVLFLKEVNEDLQLGINFEISRAEDFDKEEVFDFITARAVAPLKALIEISYKPAKIQGTFVWVKGPNVNDEIETAKKIIKKLSINIEVKKVFSELKDKEINIVEYKKNIKTPEGIPRNWAQIVK